MGEIQAAQRGVSARLGELQHGCSMSWPGMVVSLHLICISLSKDEALRDEMHWEDLFRKPAAF